MFIALKSGKPAWLISHDDDVVFSEAADLARPHHTVPSHEFFLAYREATAAELEEFTPKRREAAATLPRLKAPATKPTAPRKPSKAAGGRDGHAGRNQSSGRGQAPGSQKGAGGEPHGE